jgi:hypothetical protein
VFLGCFLTIAVFAMGMLFQSSFAPAPNHQSSGANSPKETIKQIFWEKAEDDPVAHFPL